MERGATADDLVVAVDVVGCNLLKLMGDPFVETDIHLKLLPPVGFFSALPLKTRNRSSVQSI